MARTISSNELGRADVMKEILNAFAGFGSNTELWDRDRYHVTHVEMNPDDKNDLTRVNYLKNRFPEDTILHKDAYGFIADNFDNYYGITASPDCTSHSRARMFQFSDRYKNKSFEMPDFRLYELISFLRKMSRAPWIVENVIPYYEVLIPPTAKVGRHLFWSNMIIQPKSFGSDNIMNIKKKIDRNRMNPEIGLYVLDQALKFNIQTSLEVWD